ncbi:MAG: hypothetical protein Fur0046_13780 [Cyanobacteria bacterium J069]|nr:MAG: hypothetical protein D6742_15020 [Cyanobacteria bacterium J069]
MKWMGRQLGEFFAWESYRHGEQVGQAIALELGDTPFASGMAVSRQALAWLLLDGSTPKQAASHLERCWSGQDRNEELLFHAQSASTYLGQFWS